MTDIIDLDDVLGADKRVKLGGRTYVLPPDLPVELYLKINRFAKSGVDDVDMVEALYNEIVGLFRYRAPDLESLPVSMTQLVQAIGHIYGDGSQAEEEKPVRPPRSKASGGAAKTSRKKPRTTKSGS